ncbi:hypothetical protein [Massilia niastensis]|uniref:hypothetical protein n=1 Tax=Massilia niastensis TaxID=544911 RepID=UPI00037C5859|nr:hypothetical protein [Massilia niastensis]
MKRSLVHLLLGFLICITSLQGVAAGLLACCGPLSGKDVQLPAGQGASHHAHEGGAHAAPSGAGQQHAHTPPSWGAKHEAHAAHACASCVAHCSVAAVLPDDFLPVPLLHGGTGTQAAARALADHVPDAPERPPRRHAA